MQRIDESKLPEGSHPMKRASVQYVGVKKRCRSVERHSIDLGYFPLEARCAALQSFTKAAMALHAKSIQGERVRIVLMNETVEIRGDLKIVKFGSEDIFGEEKLDVIL